MAEKTRLNELALGYAGAILAGVHMLLLSILGLLGLYQGAVSQMQQLHLFFSLSTVGILAGIVEGAIVGFIGLYALAWVYNKFA